VHLGAISSFALTFFKECEERRRDVAALEYKFFELEKQEDSLRAQAAEVPRLLQAIAALESGWVFQCRDERTLLTILLDLQQHEEESDAAQAKIQDFESRIQEADAKLAEIPTLKQSIQALETSKLWYH
jgi:chromosome segregation ATPase